MFTTFSATVTNNTVIWYFSRFYIYTFSGLFIYAALNLFVAVILGTYKKIKVSFKYHSDIYTIIVVYVSLIAMVATSIYVLCFLYWTIL